ncbi:hypothetical protein FQA39_LY00561 [Lamprigera yunnana]|nr:hypothetical protein FQA39_LY00561 [Lamprigera yunnana]
MHKIEFLQLTIAHSSPSIPDRDAPLGVIMDGRKRLNGTQAVEAVHKHFDKVVQSSQEIQIPPLSTPESKTEPKPLLKYLKAFKFNVLCCGHVNQFL